MEIYGEHQFDDCEDITYDCGNDNCEEIIFILPLRIDLFLLNSKLDMFLTYGLFARKFNKLIGVCVGDIEYGPEVDEYSEDVGENELMIGEKDCEFCEDGDNE